MPDLLTEFETAAIRWSRSELTWVQGKLLAPGDEVFLTPDWFDICSFGDWLNAEIADAALAERDEYREALLPIRARYESLMEARVEKREEGDRMSGKERGL